MSVPNILDNMDESVSLFLCQSLPVTKTGIRPYAFRRPPTNEPKLGANIHRSDVVPPLSVVLCRTCITADSHYVHVPLAEPSEGKEPCKEAWM